LSSLADSRTSVPTVRVCEELMLVDRSLGARPALGAATTVDIRYLSSLADARTSVPTVMWMIACVTYYSLVLACEAGTRR